MYGASTNRPTSFFFRLFLGEKQFTRSFSLYFRVLQWSKYCSSCCFRSPQSFSREKTSRFVMERMLPTPSMWSKQSISCYDETYFSVLLHAHSGDPTYRQTLNRNLLVEQPELKLLVSAYKQHGLRLAIGEPEKKHDSRPVSQFVVSMKHSAILGSEKKFSLIHGSSETESLSKKRRIAKESLRSAKDFPVFVYMCMPVIKDAIIV